MQPLDRREPGCMREPVSTREPNVERDSYLIAIEHYLWAREHGLTPREILDSVNVTPLRGRAITSEYVVNVLAQIHRSLAHLRRSAA